MMAMFGEGAAPTDRQTPGEGLEIMLHRFAANTLAAIIRPYIYVASTVHTQAHVRQALARNPRSPACSTEHARASNACPTRSRCRSNLPQAFAPRAKATMRTCYAQMPDALQLSTQCVAVHQAAAACAALHTFSLLYILLRSVQHAAPPLACAACSAAPSQRVRRAAGALHPAGASCTQCSAHQHRADVAAGTPSPVRDAAQHTTSAAREIVHHRCTIAQPCATWAFSTSFKSPARQHGTHLPSMATGTPGGYLCCRSL